MISATKRWAHDSKPLAVTRNMETSSVTLGRIKADFLVAIFAVLPTAAFIWASFVLRSNTILAIGLFALQFIVLWTLAKATKRYWVIALSGILLALDPVRPGLTGMSYGAWWLYLCCLVFSLSERSGGVLSAIRWGTLLVFLFVASLSFLSNTGNGVSLFSEGFQLLDILSPLVIGPVFFALTLRSPRERRFVMILVMCAVFLFYAVLMRLGTPQTLREQIGITVSEDSGYAMAYVLWGVQIYTSRTLVGIILSVICAASFVLIIGKKHLFLPYVSFILGLLGIFWGRGRGAFAALVLTMFTYTILNLRRLGRYVIGAVALCALLLGVITVSPQVNSVYQQWANRWHLTRGQTLDNGRMGKWLGAVDQIKNQPFGTAKWTLSVGQGSLKFYTHNDYLAFGVSYGLLGVLAYLLIVVNASVTLYRASKRIRDPSDKLIAGASFAAACCLGINSLTDHLLADRGLYLVSWFLVAIGCSISYRKCRNLTAGYLVSRK